jgi:hypothetical protein
MGQLQWAWIALSIDLLGMHDRIAAALAGDSV